MKIPGKIVSSLVILTVTVGIASLLYAFRPKTQKTRPQRPVPIVSVIEISPADQPVSVEAFGTVIPARKITLSSEVEGRLTAINPELVPGGIIGQGAFLAQIDPIDYELQVRERQAEVVEAEYQLEIERGKQIIARREWQLFEKNSAAIEASRKLALREPHLKNAEAKLAAAQSRLDTAELAKKRTVIKAPFNALVLEQFAETGQWVGQQTPIARLVGTDLFWIQVSVSPAELSRLKFPNGQHEIGSRVKVILDDSSNTPLTRDGHLFKLLGELDPKGRMARVLITIEDPLALQQPKKGSGSSAQAKILLGSYVRVEIAGGILENVYSIPRPAIRGNNQVWVRNRQGKLDIRQAKIKWRRKDELLVSMNIDAGEKIITSRIQTPLPGMALRVTEEGPRND